MVDGEILHVVIEMSVLACAAPATARGKPVASTSGAISFVIVFIGS